MPLRGNRRDAIGNRETQQKSLLGFVTNDTYVYDDANRLTSVNAVNYAWDNNGNASTRLSTAPALRWGQHLYLRFRSRSIPLGDNRLKTLSGGGNNVTYAYNGLGDRLRETVNGNPTTFTMDLNAGLTQALSESAPQGYGTNTYIYGMDRIAQASGTNTEYFLGDALGSVRQMINASGAITYAKAYDPYGVVTTANGASSTAYGYTNEYTSQGLVYLRARMYAPGMVRFLTRDSWMGNYNRPLSFNRWMYVEGNPVNRTDPTGYHEKYPTKEDGRDIHTMIRADFRQWGGTNALVEQPVAGANKDDAIVIKDGDTIWMFEDPDLIEANIGKADLLNLSVPEVYEIKSIHSWQTGASHAVWYKNHLNNDPRWMRYGDWQLGTLYLKKEKYIGPWPRDPKHEVWAVLYTAGVIAYYSKDQRSRLQQPSWEVDPQLVAYLAWLAALGGMGIGIINLGKGRQPGGATYGELPFDPFNLCPLPFQVPGYPGGSPWDIQPLYPAPSFPSEPWG